MGKKNKTLVIEAFPVWTSDKDVIEMIAGKRKLRCTFDDKPKGKSFVKVVGKPGKVCKFEKDLRGAKLLRTLGAFERLAEGIRLSEKTMGRFLGNRDDMEVLSIVTAKNGYYVTIGRREDRENEEDHGTTISDDSGIFGEIQSSEEDRVCLDQEGTDSSENGYLSDEDTIGPEDPGEGAGEAVVDIPVEDPVLEQEADGEWITENEYAKRYNVPASTVGLWIRKGKLKANKNVRPRLVLDGEKVPIRDQNGKKPRWLWVDRDILEDANSQVDEAL